MIKVYQRVFCLAKGPTRSNVLPTSFMAFSSDKPGKGDVPKGFQKFKRTHDK